jgi:competence protein ComEA
VEPGAAPWRVLEDPPKAATGTAPDDDPRSDAGVAMPRRALLAAAAAVAVLAVAFAIAFGSPAAGSVGVDGAAALGSAAPSEAVTVAQPGRDVLVVEIVGAVDRPGVFRLPSGSRIGDLVAAAGGYGPRVDVERAGHDLNLAALLRDGDQIRVPSRDDAGHGALPSAAGAAAITGPIDLNTATVEQLDALPGIGPVTAAKILASRQEQPFVAVADLRTRKLVGEKTFAQLKDLVTVR